MAIIVKPEMLKEIAAMLDMGMACFYHKTRGELVSYPDLTKGYDVDEEEWAEEISKVKNNPEDYIEFEAMRSNESFRIMEDFIATIDDIPAHNRLIFAISRKKPFRQFSDMLLNYPFLRERWFAYKDSRYIEYVREQI